MKTEVRMALPEDFDGVMELCRMLHMENGQFSWSNQKVEDTIRRLLNADGGYIGVIGPKDDLRGIICLVLDQNWYTEDYQLLELFNYVHPEHRRSTYAKDLIANAKKYASLLDIPLTVGVISNVRMEAKVRLYARMMPKVGEFFTFRPGH